VKFTVCPLLGIVIVSVLVVLYLSPNPYIVTFPPPLSIIVAPLNVIPETEVTGGFIPSLTLKFVEDIPDTCICVPSLESNCNICVDGLYVPPVIGAVNPVITSLPPSKVVNVNEVVPEE
jgi:hypothetical protein